MDILKAFGIKKARPMAYPGKNAPGMGLEPGGGPPHFKDHFSGEGQPRGFWQNQDRYAEEKDFFGPRHEQKWKWRVAPEWAGQVTSKDPAEQAKARPGGGQYEGWEQQDPYGYKYWAKTGVGPDPQITPMSQARKPGKFWWTNPKAEVKQYDIPDYGPQG